MNNNSVSIKEIFNTAVRNQQKKSFKVAKKLYEEITSTRSTMSKNAIEEDPELERLYKILERKKQIILYGPPGTGKTFSANELKKYILSKNVIESAKNNGNNQFSENITFHQSYSYEDFVEGIRPKITADDKVIYKPVDGIFKKISNHAKNDPNTNYVLTIDEINRGNIEKIFGELITLIESDKRIKEHQVMLPYTKESFWVPKNLFIIGTMNTADRSIAQLDTALRRRFAFTELMPESKLINSEIDGISLKKLLEALNEKIRKEGIALRDKQIGHSYFMKVNNIEDLRITFAVEIVPLLQDYFYNDYKKLEENILNSDFIDSDNMKIKEEWQKDDETFKTAINKILG